MWDFDECSGSTTVDRAGYGNIGSLVTGSSWVSDNPYPIGCSVSFNGSGYVSVSNPDNFNIDKLTVAAWVRTTASGFKTIVGRSMGTQGWNFLLDSSNTIGLRLDTSVSINQVVYPTSPSISGDKWHYVVAVIDLPSVAQILYIDGVQIAKGTASGTFNQTGGTLNIMGPANGTTALSGSSKTRFREKIGSIF